MATALTHPSNEHHLQVAPKGPPSLMNMRAADVEEAKESVMARVALVQGVRKDLMKPGVHFGKPPGISAEKAKTTKDVLLKAGAETLLMAFQIAVQYEIETIANDSDCVHYRIRAKGYSPSGVYVGEGIGEGSTDEEKYKWRRSSCQMEYDDAPENKRSIKYKTRWVKGKPTNEFDRDFRVRTNPADVANTILKMTSKRALVHLAITVTACSDMFDQDLDDISGNLEQYAAEDENQDPEVKPMTAETKPAAKGEVIPPQAQGRPTTDEEDEAALNAFADPVRESPKATVNPGGITDKQLQNLWIVAGKLKPEDVKETEHKRAIHEDIKEKYGVESSKLLTEAQAAEFIAGLVAKINEKTAAKK